MSVPNTSSYPLDTDIGTVRLLIGDTAINDARKRLFENNEIQAFLNLYGGDIKLAAASALEAIAVSESMLRKKVSTENFAIDSPAVSRVLMARAKSLREEATEFIAAGAFDIAEMNLNVFSDRDIRLRSRMRQGY